MNFEFDKSKASKLDFTKTTETIETEIRREIISADINADDGKIDGQINMEHKQQHNKQLLNLFRDLEQER